MAVPTRAVQGRRSRSKRRKREHTTTERVSWCGRRWMATCVRARDGLFVSGGREGTRAWSYGSMVCLFSWLVGWLAGWLGGWLWSEKIGHTGARTQDHSVISTALYRLSYTTSATIQHTQKQLHTPHTNQHKPTHTHLPPTPYPASTHARNHARNHHKHSHDTRYTQQQSVLFCHRAVSHELTDHASLESR